MYALAVAGAETAGRAGARARTEAGVGVNDRHLSYTCTSCYAVPSGRQPSLPVTPPQAAPPPITPPLAAPPHVTPPSGRLSSPYHLSCRAGSQLREGIRGEAHLHVFAQCGVPVLLPRNRGLHSFTLQLNLSRF